MNPDIASETKFAKIAKVVCTEWIAKEDLGPVGDWKREQMVTKQLETVTVASLHACKQYITNSQELRPGTHCFIVTFNSFQKCDQICLALRLNLRSGGS